MAETILALVALLVSAVLVVVLIGVGVLLRLTAGDERRQAVGITFIAAAL